MKIFKYILAAAVLFTTSLASAELKVGIVDMRQALFNSDSAKALVDATSGEFKKQELEVRAIGEKGRKMEMRLKNDAALMSDNERSKLASDLEGVIQEYQYRKGKLDKAMAEKRNEFLSASAPKIDQAVNELVKEENLDLLMPREAVLFAKESMDYTDKITEKLNKLK